MIINKDTALKIAEHLLQIKAIKLQPNQPFQWASGWISPIYCDNRKTLSYPKIRTYIRQQLVNAIQENFSEPDYIAGVATGGIAQGVLVAQDLGLPFVYVRSEMKGHGLKNQIEGDISSGQSVVVIEDLISTGGSSLNAVKALKNIGCDVKGLVSIFDYGFKIAEENFKSEKCSFFSLSNYASLLEKAADSGYINEKDIDSLKQWNESPQDWGK
ncbi:MAG: orotate phosphoribosyltransferase [Flavobacteriales bacterium]|nr:orotate phosphoribosyltransferase [Flavobacteriales bacterium]